MGMHHTTAQFEGGGTLIAAFKILDTAGTPTIVNIAPPASQTSDFAITDTAQGVYDVVISNFKGPQGVAVVFATPQTINLSATCTAQSYTGDALALTIKTVDDAHSATDTSSAVLVLAY
jgi:hypothetical protein